MLQNWKHNSIATEPFTANRAWQVHVVGVDFSEEVINANKSRYPDIDWLCLDAGTLRRWDPETPGRPIPEPYF